jgi:hypothetical protein
VAAIDYWKDEPWLHLNNVYTYGPVYVSALKQYARPERMPFFLIESRYEGEGGVSHAQRMRVQAYHAILSGASGHLFGNNPIWRFDGPPVYPAPLKWPEALGSPGAHSMSHLRALLLTLPWWTLEPDDRGTLIVAGRGVANDRVVAARSADRSIALVYVPTVRSVSIHLDGLAGPSTIGRWYDPAAGRYLPATASPVRTSGIHTFRPLSRNSAGDGDWVLVLETSGNRS